MSRRPRRKSAEELADEQWPLIDALAESNVQRSQEREWLRRWEHERHQLRDAAVKHFRSVLGEASSSASASAGA